MLKYVLILSVLWLALLLALSYCRILLRKFIEPFQQAIRQDLNGVRYPVSYWTERGGRQYQEDRHDALRGPGSDDCSLYGVFDGHGGHRASQYCYENMLRSIVAHSMFVTNPTEALISTYHRYHTMPCHPPPLDVTKQNQIILLYITFSLYIYMTNRIDNEFISLSKKCHFSDGTTAVVAVITDGRVLVANAGDSRGILVQRGGRAYAMSIDHKPSRSLHSHTYIYIYTHSHLYIYIYTTMFPHPPYPPTPCTPHVERMRNSAFVSSAERSSSGADGVSRVFWQYHVR